MNKRIGIYIEPPIELAMLYSYLEKTTLALAELNSIHKTIPNTALFIYMYVRKEALLSSQIEGLMHKYKRFQGNKTKAGKFLENIAKNNPNLFAHWKIGMIGSFA